MTPTEFDELSMLDADDLIKAYEVMLQQKRWETAYWTANMMSVHTKRAVKPDKLMKPFLNKPKENKINDGEEFFSNFRKARKEALSNGDNR